MKKMFVNLYDDKIELTNEEGYTYWLFEFDYINKGLPSSVIENYTLALLYHQEKGCSIYFIDKRGETNEEKK